MPNDSFTQQCLAADPQFRKRVRSAFSSVAWQIENEDAATANHAARLQYAQQVIRNLDSETTIVLPTIVFRPNVINFTTSYQFDFVTQVGQTVSACGDADLLSQLATDWDALAAAAGFAPPAPPAV